MLMAYRSATAMALPLQCVMGFVLSGPRLSEAAEPPVLQIAHPASGERYAASATIAIQAEFDPLFSLSPDVRLYEVLDDGLLMPQGRITGRSDADGRLSVDVGPGANGWPSGRMRIVVIPEYFPKQRQVIEVEIIPKGDSTRTSGEPIRSEVIIDLDSADVPPVPAGQVIAVKGQFEWDEDAHGPAPASLIVQVRQPDADSKGDVIRNDATAACSRDRSDRFDFYAEIEIPAEAGKCRLRAYLPYMTSLGEVQHKPIERELSIRGSE